MSNFTTSNVTDALTVTIVDDPVDVLWILVCAFLAIFMQVGFAMLEVGVARAKNTQSILVKNAINVGVGAMCFYFLGYGFAFGESAGGFIGSSRFAFQEEDGIYGHRWTFQLAFLLATVAIFGGALIERTQLGAYVLMATVMSLFVFPVQAHWAWGDGWLKERGFLDFAGGAVVHVSGGMTALVGAVAVGRRQGRFSDGVEEHAKTCTAKFRPGTDRGEFEPSNVPLMVLGTFILWFGWYGFNSGSSLGISTPEQVTVVSMVAKNTTIAAFSCSLVVLLFRFLNVKCRRDMAAGDERLLDLPGMLNGILAGLVSITAGCGYVRPYAALVIGIVAGFVYVGASAAVRATGVDDPPDAFAVHGACGAWGVLAVGIFHAEIGLVAGGDGLLLGWQVAGALVIGLWAFLFAVLVFLPMRACKALRVAPQVELVGLDQFTNRSTYAGGDHPINQEMQDVSAMSKSPRYDSPGTSPHSQSDGGMDDGDGDRKSFDEGRSP